MLSCLEDLNLIDAGSGDMPYPTIEVAYSATQLTEIETKRSSALHITANTRDLAAITYALADTKKKVNIMNLIAAIRKTVEIRLLQKAKSKIIMRS